MDNAPIKFYNKAWFMWFMLILFAPVGLILLWKNKKYNRFTRLILTSVFAIWFLFTLIPSNNNTQNKESNKNNTITEPSEKIAGNPGNIADNGQQSGNAIITASPIPTVTDTMEYGLDTTPIETPVPKPEIKPSPKKSPITNTTNGKIKGNISSSGEKIYHMPSGAYYESTKAEEYFNTEEEAKAAGYRRSKR